MRDGDQLISHVLAELRQITELRIEFAVWKRTADQRLDSLDKKSGESLKRLEALEKSSGLAAYMRQHALALLQWASALIIAGLAAASLLPPWVGQVFSALGRAK